MGSVALSSRLYKVGALPTHCLVIDGGTCRICNSRLMAQTWAELVHVLLVYVVVVAHPGPAIPRSGRPAAMAAAVEPSVAREDGHDRRGGQLIRRTVVKEAIPVLRRPCVRP